MQPVMVFDVNETLLELSALDDVFRKLFGTDNAGATGHRRLPATS